MYNRELHFSMYNSCPAHNLQMRPRIHGVRLSVAYSINFTGMMIQHQHNQEIAQLSFPLLRVGSGDETTRA